ncbi:MAG: M23 family metallopeptidase, partial [bacterium]|nr:M23 family metallopeptidase [bacterium]
RVKHLKLWAVVALLLTGLSISALAARAQGTRPFPIQPGDTWSALAFRFGVEEAALRESYGHINRQRQPVIGETLLLPDGAEQMGKLIRPFAGGLLETAVTHNLSPWTVALQNQRSPYQPLFYGPLFLPSSTPPRDLPVGFEGLELSKIPANPGESLGIRSTFTQDKAFQVYLNNSPFTTAANGRHFVALNGTGAFFGGGTPELLIHSADSAPAWSQPWLFVDKQWSYQQITLTGTAATITSEEIQQERERLFTIWRQVTPLPQWQAEFDFPVDAYLEISSEYGARRSYNGGPYRSYHEGVDFSAYGGTAVTAPAAGTIVLAEFLKVRGGTVIIDHGLGVYSGYYHMSGIETAVGTQVSAGDLIGKVGTTGLSTGNHLHWDLLVNAIWIDAKAWTKQNSACWILEGLGKDCQTNP